MCGCCQKRILAENGEYIQDDWRVTKYGGAMLSLNIENERIFFNDITPEQLPAILTWYNQVEEFMFATGIDRPISLESLRNKYSEIVTSRNDFFVGIYDKKRGCMLGILKGRLKQRDRSALWISSMAIACEERRKGYGKAAIGLLTEQAGKNNGVKSIWLSVVEDNIIGRIFWKSLGFDEIKKVESPVRLHGSLFGVFIMRRNI